MTLNNKAEANGGKRHPFLDSEVACPPPSPTLMLFTNVWKCALLVFAMVYAAIFAGCTLPKAVIRSVMEVGLDPAFELADASNQFRVANHRWPGNYGELSIFLKETGDRTCRSLQAVKYDRVHFTEMSDGELRIEADYILNSAREFDSDAAMNYSATGRIDMVISPFDFERLSGDPKTK